MHDKCLKIHKTNTTNVCAQLLTKVDQLLGGGEGRGGWEGERGSNRTVLITDSSDHLLGRTPLRTPDGPVGKIVTWNCLQKSVATPASQNVMCVIAGRAHPTTEVLFHGHPINVMISSRHHTWLVAPHLLEQISPLVARGSGSKLKFCLFSVDQHGSQPFASALYFHTGARFVGEGGTLTNSGPSSCRDDAQL